VRDKQVRRRRTVLALLVGISLILLTAYFGESTNSPLHTIQRGVVEVLSPIQQGANKALTPVRDVAGWVSDTLHAKSQVDKLRTQVQQLNARLAQAQQQAIDYPQLAKEVGLDNNGLSAYHLVAAHVIGQDPTVWYEQIEVDKGSLDGVQKDDPVIGDGALVGKVSLVDSTVCEVTLITDHTFGVAAEVQDSVGDRGLLVPAVGSPNQLLLQDLTQTGPFHETAGQVVVTDGFSDGSLVDLYPPNIPIGVVSNANQDTLVNSGQIQVSPFADLRHLDSVQILTRPHAGTESASLP
jgi:rod shape-determining protein MreC